MSYGLNVEMHKQVRHHTSYSYSFCGNKNKLFVLQTEISKRLSALINQLVPFLSQEHRQQVLTAVERAKQITMAELNAVIEVSHKLLPQITISRR